MNKGQWTKYQLIGSLFEATGLGIVWYQTNWKVVLGLFILAVGVIIHADKEGKP